MDNLARVIGEAPSESTMDAFLKRLSKERERMFTEISSYKRKAAAPRKKAAPKVPLSKVDRALLEAGLSYSDLVGMLQKKLEKKEVPDG